MTIKLYAACVLSLMSSLCSGEMANFIDKIAPSQLSPQIKESDEFAWPPNFRFFENQILASASGQFSKRGLDRIVQEYPDREIVVIDLRREFHGFVDGFPISWKLSEDSVYGYNTDLTIDQIEAGEEDLLMQMKEFDQVQTERQLVEAAGARYLRFPISDHFFPRGEEVDHFVDLIRSFGKDSWVHFHCAGGCGRSTVFLAMLDMMQNSHLYSADEILRRQEAIGGANLYDPERRYADQPERIKGATERLQFLQSFHQFCLENPDFSQSWTFWAKEK